MNYYFNLNNTSFNYSKVSPIFNRINVSLKSGYIVGFLGENGAGKTTLFDIISRYQKIQSGQLESNIREDQIINIPQVVTLPPYAKMKEVVEMIACFNKISSNDVDLLIEKEWAKEMLHRFQKIKNKRTGLCSYGEKRWLFLSATLTLYRDKKLFILDEPTVGIDIHNRYLIWQLIHHIKSNNKIIAFSSHLIDEVEKHSDYFYFLKNQKAEKHIRMSDFIKKYNGKDAEDAFIKTMKIL